MRLAFNPEFPIEPMFGVFLSEAIVERRTKPIPSVLARRRGASGRSETLQTGAGVSRKTCTFFCPESRGARYLSSKRGRSIGISGFIARIVFAWLFLLNSSAAYADWYVSGTMSDWAPVAMKNMGGSYELDVTFKAGGGQFIFDRVGDGAEKFGDVNRDFVADPAGAPISVVRGAGVYKITFDPATYVYSIAKSYPPSAVSANPYIISTNIEDGETNVSVNTAITGTPNLVNGAGINAASVNTTSVQLLEKVGGVKVAANVNTTGGGDAVTLQPIGALKGQTEYVFKITADLTDETGASFLPYQIAFKTGDKPCCGDATGFKKVKLTAPPIRAYTAITLGPDRKIYAATMDGEIWRFGIKTDGTLASAKFLIALKQASGAKRTITALKFDPRATATNLILWVSNGGLATRGATDWTGRLTRLTGVNVDQAKDYVTGLPHSFKDHMNNGILFGPDGALYILVASNSGLGAADSTWGNRPERLLSAALLRVNLNGITNPPINVKTEEGGKYDPFAANAPVTLYATGLRNSYDMVWHSNGQLYATLNGSAPGSNTPGTPNPLPAICKHRIDFAMRGAYTGPSVPAIRGVPTNSADHLVRIERGGYYGHPNPKRCEWVLDGGNPTSSSGDPSQVSAYPVGVKPDRNFRGFAFNFGGHKSANGIIELKFPSRYTGQMFVTRYSEGDDIVALTPGGSKLEIVASKEFNHGTALTGFNNPIDLAEDRTNGNIYVAELGSETGRTGGISLLRLVNP